MKVPFTWKVTGWFMIGWSAEFGASEVRPLRYFGEDLVAYRDESGELHVLSGHCRHLGAHIGHGGKVVGDCVECPFHGWRWGPDGTNRYIPYQPDRPNRALRLRVFPVREQYGCVFIWHQPDGKEPQWDLPDLFGKFPQFDTDGRRAYRRAVSDAAMGAVRPMLAYKSARYSGELVVADRWFPSSQIHHGCTAPDGTPCRLVGRGRIDKLLVCAQTGHVVDRDRNAARNLRDWPDHASCGPVRTTAPSVPGPTTSVGTGHGADTGTSGAGGASVRPRPRGARSGETRTQTPQGDAA